MPGLEVYPATSWRRRSAQLEAGGGGAAPPADLDALLAAAPPGDADFSDIVGQDGVKRALEVAVAGGAQRPHDRSARRGQDHARAPAAGHHAAAHAATRPSRSRASTAWRACCRRASRSWCGGRSARRTTPSPRRARGRRRHAAPGRGEPRPPRRALSRRVPGVPALGPRGPAPAAGGRRGHHQPQAHVGDVPGAADARRGDEPVPLRLRRRPRPRVRLPGAIACDQYRSRLSGPLLDRIDLRLDVPRVPPRDRREKRRSELVGHRPRARDRRPAGARWSGSPAPASTPTRT